MHNGTDKNRTDTIDHMLYFLSSMVGAYVLPCPGR